MSNHTSDYKDLRKDKRLFDDCIGSEERRWPQAANNERSVSTVDIDREKWESFTIREVSGRSESSLGGQVSQVDSWVSN